MPDENIFCDEDEVRRYKKTLNKLGRNYSKKFTWKLRNNKDFRERFLGRLQRIIPQIEVREEYPEFMRGNPLLIERRIMYFQFISQDLKPGEFFLLDRLISISVRMAKKTFEQRKEAFQENIH